MPFAIPITDIPASDEGVALLDVANGCDGGSLTIFGNSIVELSLTSGPWADPANSPGPWHPVGPGLYPITGGTPGAGAARGQLLYGIRARQLAGSNPSVTPRAYGVAFQPGEARLTPSASIAGSLSASGTVTTGGSAITGWVRSDGVILGGTGFTVNHTGTGRYTVTYDTPFASTPLLLLTSDGNFASIFSVSESNALANIGINAVVGGAALDGNFWFEAKELT